jgi:hypothetical protein
MDTPLLPDGRPAGWWVTDPDGNVVDCGPDITLEVVANSGE